MGNIRCDCEETGTWFIAATCFEMFLTSLIESLVPDILRPYSLSHWQCLEQAENPIGTHSKLLSLPFSHGRNPSFDAPS